MTEPEIVAIASDQLKVEVSTQGAELQSIRDAHGHELLWNGDPAFWTGRAPILFPVIGVTSGGVIRVDGRTYPMPKHGVARHRRWAVAARDDAAVTLRLEADAGTRENYPFEFRLDVRFAVEGETLAVTATLHNPGAVPLPASFGFHPALHWPLPFGAPRDRHIVRFAEDEPAPIRRIDGEGLLRPAPEPTPVEGRDLHPRDALFEDDALIFDRHRSRAVTFGAPGSEALAVSFPDMAALGIWTKPGAPFLCIEPWAGIADPEGFAGEFRDKPGVEEVAPGGSRTYSLAIALAGRALG